MAVATGLKKETKGLKRKEDARLKELRQQQEELQARYNEIKQKYDSYRGSGGGQKGVANPHAQELRSITNQLNAVTKEANLRAQGKNPDGSFIRPEWESLIDPDTGLLSPEYTLGDKWQDVVLDSAGYDQFAREATRDAGTPSAWADMMLNRADMEKQAEIDRVAASQNAGLRAAYDDLAAQGGISSGARERIAQGGLRDMIMGRQTARRNAEMDKMNALTQDEQNRVQMLSQLPGMELQRGQFDLANQQGEMTARQFDTQQAIGQMDKERQAELDAWMKNQEVWGANKQAEAQARASSGGGCFPKGTLITMANESKKKIEDIVEGDVILGGGEVVLTINLVNEAGYDLYDYCGALVTGSHAVFEGDEWVRVRDAKLGVRLNGHITRVYNLITKHHLIISNNVLFSDYIETDEDYEDEEMSLRALNGDVI